MENFIVSARKYRPSTFENVIGQPSITNTLKNAIKNNHLAQAFLFCGPRGVGKTTCARILAKTINCQNITENIEACNSCDSCNGFNENLSFNIHELDAASNNGVDKIRDLVDQVRFVPQIGQYNIYIIDEVHMLSQGAFNAFLKTLEEPPAHAIFILATTEKYKIIPTILSRCQIFDFKRIQLEDIVKHLDFVAKKEGVNAEHDALHIIAQKADGALRDALSIFDQIVSFCGSEMNYNSVIENLNILDCEYFFKVTDSVLANNIPESLNLFNEILKNGFEGHNFINGLGEHFRNLLVCQDPATLSLLEVGKNIKEKYQAQATTCSQTLLLQALELCNKADIQYKISKNKRLLVEITLMQLCGLDGTNETPSGEKKTFVIKPQPSNETKKTINESTNNSLLEEVKKEEHKQTPPSNDDKVLKSVVSLKERPTKKRTISIDLDNFNNDKKQKEKEVQEERVETPFTQKDLEASWKNFATKIGLEGKHNLSSILKEKTPIISDDFVLELTLNNKVQEEVLNEEKSNILSYLKKSLINNSIQINIIMRELEKQEIKAYTPEDKFKEMAEKNPTLLEMKDQFGLELDY